MRFAETMGGAAILICNSTCCTHTLVPSLNVGECECAIAVDKKMTWQDVGVYRTGSYGLSPQGRPL